ncbi:phosphoribosylformylglycinamidine synthase subunit PurS [Alkalibacillus haloalkaliphilus]|uniref:phosphoribosylformylglycinamidine synthase subunit PurS n=1 Tax=Alkalibacillus haloalkaliphilus TaxID=94136 RepID=UPI002936201D|nr:phosphoribosylformylglycinamidine synthase subunit PurS [Alkalibacillus haloalkaliphilus]MDV2582633.1 phosphoribosylformylglycinamidine synthase subunit PurS [Alkalibacillus haloalkaliphilus]
MVIKVKVYVTLKAGVLDPQGKAIEQALEAMNVNNVEGMRVGKYMEFHLEPEKGQSVDEQVTHICEQLLSNPVIEDYRYETEEVITP